MLEKCQSFDSRGKKKKKTDLKKFTSGKNRRACS